MPDNITLVPLPAKCLELIAQETVWQFMRENWLLNRFFGSNEDLLDHCCAAWNRLVDQPWRIMSLGLHDWAHGFRSEGLVLLGDMDAQRLATDGQAVTAGL